MVSLEENSLFQLDIPGRCKMTRPKLSMSIEYIHNRADEHKIVLIRVFLSSSNRVGSLLTSSLIGLW